MIFMPSSSLNLKGSLVIRQYQAPPWILGLANRLLGRRLFGPREPIFTSRRFDNTIVSSDGYGKNIIARQIGGNTTYLIGVDSGAIGTGTTAPAASDTGLQTPVLSGIDVALVEFPAANQVVISFFIPDASLANGTYTEFGLFMNLRLFARDLFGAAYTKTAGKDTTIEYTITL